MSLVVELYHASNEYMNEDITVAFKLQQYLSSFNAKMIESLVSYQNIDFVEEHSFI